MSHFTVLVVGKNPEEQLAPFHQFECTGEDDQYVQDIDKTAGLRKEYQTRTETKYRDQNGVLHDPYENRFYREFTEKEWEKCGSNLMGSGGNGTISWTSRDWEDGKGYRAKVHFLPEGFEKVEVPYSETKTFAEFVESWESKEVVAFGKKPDLKKTHKYGYILLNEKGEVDKVIDRTNPNYKWDWYQLGGRWSGYFKLKNGKNADSAQIKDIDFEGMMGDAGKAAGEKYDRVLQAFEGKIEFKHLWKDLLKNESLDIEDKRMLYHSQPIMKQLSNLRNSGSRDDQSFYTWLNLEDFLVSREEYVNAARSAAISTFAVLKDGVWYERGEMGWFGCVGNEKDENPWQTEFAKLIRELPGDTLVSVYDCHI